MSATAAEMALGQRLDFTREESRIAAINQVIGYKRLAASALARSLAPLLVALDWFGAPRAVLEHLPAEGDDLSLSQYCELIQGFGFSVDCTTWSAWKNGLDALPTASVILSGSDCFIYLGRLHGIDWWHDGAAVCSAYAPKPGDTLLLIENDIESMPIDLPQLGWLKKLMVSARRELIGVLLISLVVNLLLLSVSFYTMNVYNTVIPGGATGTLWTLTTGVAIAILGGWWLRVARSKILADLTAWAGSKIGAATLRKTLGLPVDVSARLGIDNNLSRLRSVEGVRQFFGGAGGLISFDYPMIPVFLIAIGIMGGWVVVVPIISLIVFAGLSIPFSSYIESHAAKMGRASRKFNDLTSVLASRLRTLRGVPGSSLSRQHLAELVAQTVEANRDYALANSLVQSVGNSLGMLTVLATMGVGVLLVLSNNMTSGGLIATMMLIWKVTVPAQQAFTAKVRIKQLLDSGRQLDRLMTATGELQKAQGTSPVSVLTAEVTADRLFYRYSAEREPALNGISFKIDPGKFVAVTGPNGAGKTTLLDMLAGLFQPQNGRVLVGGQDIRQFDLADYRSWLGYLPQEIPTLPLTVRNMMSLRCPAASDDQMFEALQRVGGPDWWRLIGADGPAAALELKMEPWREDRDAIIQRFVVRLAASIMGNPKLLLLDDPLRVRNPQLDGYMITLLEELRGTTTIILATHRPDLIQRADEIVLLNEGNLVYSGPVAPPTQKEA
ncbi:MAG: ATP-binding cassette domain-containing protein [Trichlorobacter sp.]|uniref:ATP-binding cassette domain-containing protein n=1 Tax=Trichlorobacter sp. TaxID=2911007 RepID=UPI00255FCFE6|nr:ATP-binding cassette domain-containing protein [Trichlorobacter sp.]MDK9716594.1 ATP-binding cassette domain-containing protein [Trichlorobacter sp.]